jgi:phage terminase large subunit-like protein
LTISPPAVRLGVREPRFLHLPPAASSAGPEAIELAASAGLMLDPWQQDVLCGGLGERPDGKWAATEVGLVVPRQDGKGAIFEALELAGLFLFDDWRLLTHTAHRVDTCLEHFRRVRELVEGTPDLSRRVRTIRNANGQESIELTDGTRLNFKARSKGAGRGFSGDLVVLDEAFYLQDLGGMIPTMAARVNPQVWYGSSAPLPREESNILRRLVHRGRALSA